MEQELKVRVNHKFQKMMSFWTYIDMKGHIFFLSYAFCSTQIRFFGSKDMVNFSLQIYANASLKTIKNKENKVS